MQLLWEPMLLYVAVLHCHQLPQAMPASTQSLFFAHAHSLTATGCELPFDNTTFSCMTMQGYLSFGVSLSDTQA